MLDDIIISDEISNITTDLLEVSLDRLLDDGIIKDIPIVSTAYSIAKIGFNIKERFFTKKILNFLFQLKNIPNKARNEFIQKLNEDEKYSNKVGEKLLVLIDRLDDTKKAEYIGKLFSSCIEGYINYDTFLRLSMVIDKCYLSDLDKLSMYFDLKEGDIYGEILFSLGLLETYSIQRGAMIMHGESSSVSNKMNYKINHFGLLLLKILFPS